MKKQVLYLWFIVAMVVVPWINQAQTLGEYTYTTGVDTTKWVDMSSSTTILTRSSNGDAASTVRNIGFSFPFGPDNYTQYSVNTDGNLRLGSTATTTSSYATPFSSANANINNPKINFFATNGYFIASSHYVKAHIMLSRSSPWMPMVTPCLWWNTAWVLTTLLHAATSTSGRYTFILVEKSKWCMVPLQPPPQGLRANPASVSMPPTAIMSMAAIPQTISHRALIWASLRATGLCQDVIIVSRLPLSPAPSLSAYR